MSGVCLRGGWVAETESISVAGLFLEAITLPAPRPGCGAGEMLIFDLGSGIEIAFSFPLSRGLDVAEGSVSSGFGDAVELADEGGPPSLASLRRRICSIVSWSGASGVAGAAGGARGGGGV